MRLLLAVVAVAVAPVLALPAVAAEECGSGVHVGSCYVHDPDGSYTCTVGHVGVELAVGTGVQTCLIEWQP